MGPKILEKYVTTGKQREDRAEHSKNKFDPLRLEVKYPGTAILLLQCEEKPILLSAATALSKFAIKSQENVETLFDLNILENVFPLIEHEDLYTRRFAAVLLAEMTRIPNVSHYLLESEYYIPHFLKVFMKETDAFMQEFSSSILSELSKDTYGVSHLLNYCSDMDFLFEMIQSSDPDLKRNTVEIIYNLLQDPIGAKQIINVKSFSMSLIYELFASTYPEIQRLALNVVAVLVSRNKDEPLQHHFRKTNGLQILLDFLDNDEWYDLHAEVLGILSLASDNPGTVEMLNDIGGIRRILKYLDDTPNSKLFLHAFDVVVHLSHISSGRETLHRYGILDHLLRSLKSKLPDIYEISCRGIGMMARYNPAAEQLTAENCIKNILDILKNENLKWPPRQAALFALNELFKYDSKNCNTFLDLQGHNYCRWLVNESKVPAEVRVAAVEGFIIIAKYMSLRDVIINIDFVDALCASFELNCPTMNELKIASCNALSIICINKIGRDAFLAVNGPCKIFNLLSDMQSIPVRNAAVQLVQLLCADPLLADSFVAANYLPYMLNNRSSAGVIPTWDTCVEALFCAHLPIKFAFIGRLSLHDVTQDGFYILKRNVCPFPILDDIFRFKFCPLEPVYVVNCNLHRSSTTSEKTSNELLLQEPQNPSKRRSISNAGILSPEKLNASIKNKFGHLRCDSCLYEYIELFKCKIIAAETKNAKFNGGSELVDIRYIETRAKMLAKFVARQMSGPDPTTKCIDHQLEIHIKEIKDRIETSLIPLGMLRVGSYLERALLFKVVADRVGLPAALVRGQYGRAWIEIAIPQIDAPAEVPLQDTDKSSSDIIATRDVKSMKFTSLLKKSNGSSLDEDKARINSPTDNRQTIFPKKLMKPNFIVDLMDVPGDLIPIVGKRADMYCGQKVRT